MALAVTAPAQRMYVSDAAVDAIAVTASDSTDDPNGPFYALYVGVAGNISLVTLEGNAVLLTAVPIGILKIGCKRVNASNTAAASTIIGLK